MALVTIRKWIGGLGNNLEQIAYAIWLAKSTNGQFLCDPEHHLLNVPKSIIFGNNIDEQHIGAFTNNEFIKRGLDLGNERFKHAHLILQDISSILFHNIPKKSFDGFVVHVRAGNIFRKPSVGRYLIQAPLSYFAKVVETLNINKNILVVTSERHGRDGQPGSGLFPNPMVAEILKYCKSTKMSCRVHDGPIDEAAGYFLHAKHAILTGYTTFSRTLLLANSNLKTVVIPAISDWPHDEISFKKHQCDTHYFDIVNYLNEWSAEGLRKQITHPADKILYREAT